MFCHHNDSYSKNIQCCDLLITSAIINQETLENLRFFGYNNRTLSENFQLREKFAVAILHFLLSLK